MAVTIHGIESRSRAERAGIRPGDVLVSINGHEIVDVLDYRFFGYDADPELVLDPARRLRERFPNLLGVAYTQREQISSAFTVEAEEAKNLSISELFSQFYQEITGVSLSEDAVKLVSDAAYQAEKEAHE